MKVDRSKLTALALVWILAVACGSRDLKKRVRPDDEGGAGGEANAVQPVGGEPAAPNGGEPSLGGEPGTDAGGQTSAVGAAGTGTMAAAGRGSAAVASEKFSFFVTSLSAMLALSNNPNGFGGDLRYGEASGLAGADKICSEIAESSMPGSASKQWRAFLSTTTSNAADRIGVGPWYDRTGRLLANNLAQLLMNRPGGDPAIAQDLPNESGVPNHQPDPSMPQAANSHVLTGSDATGRLYGPTATCLDWTSSEADNAVTGRPRVGFAWPQGDQGTWISATTEGGCGAGVQITKNGGENPDNPVVGSGGGYGAIYCFALSP